MRNNGCIAVFSATIALVAANRLATSAPQSDAELTAVLAELRAELDELRAATNGSQQWLNEARAEEVKQLVRDVLSDAGSRTSFDEGYETSGFIRGLWVGSADGNFRLAFRGFTQVRYTVDQRNETTGAQNSNDSTWGFEDRRTRISLEGCAGDPSWRYRAEFQTGSGQATMTATDLWIEKSFSDELSLRVGQFKPGYLREFDVSALAPVFADRSSTAVFFLPQRTIGAQLTWESEDFRLQATFANAFEVRSNYYNSGNLRGVPWNSPQNAPYAVLGRAAWLAAGTWEQLASFTGWRGGEFGALVGVAGQVMKRNNNVGVPTAYGDIKPLVIGATADVTLQFNGASLSSWFAWRQIDPCESGLAAANQYGVVIQGGLFVSDEVELIARYEYGSADTMPNGETPVVQTLPSNNGYSTISAASLGVNWYIARQRVRITTDVSYAFTGIGAFADPNSNFLQDGTSASGAFDADGQVLIRAQLQIIF